MMVLKYWMMKERILNRNYSSASNWNPSFLVDDLKKLHIRNVVQRNLFRKPTNTYRKRQQGAR